MGPKEKELTRVVLGPRYSGMDSLEQISSRLERHHNEYALLSADPGWKGLSAVAASRAFAHQSETAGRNAAPFKTIGRLLEEANTCVEAAESQYHALPTGSVDDGVLQAFNTFGNVSITGYGQVASVAGLWIYRSFLAGRRERAAGQILGDLTRSLDLVSHEIQGQLALLRTSKGTALVPPPMDSGSGDPEAGPDSFGFSLGSPERPHIEWDEDFIYDSEEPTNEDRVNWAKWGAITAGAKLLRPDLRDALEAYENYRSNTGDPLIIDAEKGYSEDGGIRASTDVVISDAIRSADGYAREGMDTFSITGPASQNKYRVETENWQKTIGGHQLWASGDITVEGDRATMDVTVHLEDYYNFNRGQQDIETGIEDNENGRFTEIGWAKPFHSSGTVERTVTWTLGEPDAAGISEGPTDFDTGRHRK